MRKQFNIFLFSVPLQKIVWSIIRMAFNITPPLNINGTLPNGVPKIEKVNIRLGTCAILGAIWHVRNDFIFNKSRFLSFLQVIPLAIYWIRM
jgi:hypothetical protein